MIRAGERIQFANEAYAKIFGYDNADEMVGQPCQIQVCWR